MPGSFVSRFRSRWFLLLLCLAVLVLAGQGIPKALSASPNSSLTVIDGDTLELDGRPIDLAGIDAPELGQWCLDGSNLYRCGLTAAFELNKLIELQPITCAPADTQTAAYECRTPNTTLDVLLLEDGLVIATFGAQREMAEAKARNVPLGVWRGPLVEPSAWRNGTRLPEEVVAADDCPILAIDLEGVRTYVVPTDREYAALEAHATEVERRFCSDEAARAEGYIHTAAR
jgi:endonuclease YncB( thermonuclease family)